LSRVAPFGSNGGFADGRGDSIPDVLVEFMKVIGRHVNLNSQAQATIIRNPNLHHEVIPG
jgi:hypothetical protein